MRLKNEPVFDRHSLKNEGVFQHRRHFYVYGVGGSEVV